MLELLQDVLEVYAHETSKIINNVLISYRSICKIGDCTCGRAGEEVPVWAFGISKLHMKNSFVYGYVKPSDLDRILSRHSRSTLANYIKR